MKLGTGRIVITAAVALVTAGIGPAVADPVATPQPEAVPVVRFGADERVRQEYFDHIPVKSDGDARGGENDYFRFRTRVWSEADAGPNVTFRIRAVNEMRDWLYPDVSQKMQRSTYEWPDEIVFDAAYMDVHGLFNDTLDLRVGRQDLIYGTGKVILEGTPGDGSRTIYFNAVKAVLKPAPKTTIDVFGIYNPAQDEFAINPADPARDESAMPATMNGMLERGAGVYAKNQTFASLPFEVYGIYKSEGTQAINVKPDAKGNLPQPTAPWQTLDVAAKQVDVAAADIGTVGTRLMPKLTDSLSGNLELAYQFGTRGDADINAYMADAFVVQQLPGSMKPAVDAGVYYLSGDRKSTQDEEGWDPLWARYPQYSELYVYAYDSDMLAAGWNNLCMPHAGLTLNPLAKLKTTLSVNYLYAPEADGPGGGHERGWLGIFKNEFTLAENKWLPKDKLTGHLWLEVLNPGDYYNVNDLALFARWEFCYAF